MFWKIKKQVKLNLQNGILTAILKINRHSKCLIKMVSLFKIWVTTKEMPRVMKNSLGKNSMTKKPLLRIYRSIKHTLSCKLNQKRPIALRICTIKVKKCTKIMLCTKMSFLSTEKFTKPGLIGNSYYFKEWIMRVKLLFLVSVWQKKSRFATINTL